MAAQTAKLPSAVDPVVAQVQFVLCIALAVLGFVTSVFWTLERRRTAGRLIFVVCVVSTICLALGIQLISATWKLHWGWVFLSDLSSALTLGSAMSGMLLGHSYLTSPTMSISPLLRLNLYLGVAGIIRGAISGIVLVTAWPHLTDSSSLTWLVLRWIAGVAGPILVWQMVQRILAFKNTQAATGVLFVGAILTLLGELTGTLLLTVTGYPL